MTTPTFRVGPPSSGKPLRKYKQLPGSQAEACPSQDAFLARSSLSKSLKGGGSGGWKGIDLNSEGGDVCPEQQ